MPRLMRVSTERDRRSLRMCACLFSEMAWLHSQPTEFCWFSLREKGRQQGALASSPRRQPVCSSVHAGVRVLVSCNATCPYALARCSLYAWEPPTSQTSPSFFSFFLVCLLSSVLPVSLTMGRRRGKPIPEALFYSPSLVSSASSSSTRVFFLGLSARRFAVAENLSYTLGRRGPFEEHLIVAIVRYDHHSSRTPTRTLPPRTPPLFL